MGDYGRNFDKNSTTTNSNGPNFNSVRSSLSSGSALAIMQRRSKDRKRKHEENNCRRTKIALEKLTLNISSSDEIVCKNRISFVKFMVKKLDTDICNGKADVKLLTKLLFDASYDIQETTLWGISELEVDDPIEIIRPKSKEKKVDFKHARIQPLNWACRRGHLELLKYLINASPWDDIFSPNLGNDKLFLGAITFGILSGSIDMVNYLVQDLGMDPNRGPKDWEPLLVVFWEHPNWDMLLTLVKG